MNGMVANCHNLHIFASERHHVPYHLLLSFSPSHTIHINQHFSCARWLYHLLHLSLIIIFFSGSISSTQSCVLFGVLFVIHVSLTQTIYISTSCAHYSVHLPFTYSVATLVLCSLLHSFSPSPYIILYLYGIYIYIRTGKYSVCTAMRLAEVSSILFESPFISSYIYFFSHDRVFSCCVSTSQL